MDFRSIPKFDFRTTPIHDWVRSFQDTGLLLVENVEEDQVDDLYEQLADGLGLLVRATSMDVRPPVSKYFTEAAGPGRISHHNEWSGSDDNVWNVAAGLFFTKAFKDVVGGEMLFARNADAATMENLSFLEVKMYVQPSEPCVVRYINPYRQMTMSDDAGTRSVYDAIVKRSLLRPDRHGILRCAWSSHLTWNDHDLVTCFENDLRRRGLVVPPVSYPAPLTLHNDSPPLVRYFDELCQSAVLQVPRKGDVVIFDNLRWTHARNEAGQGERKIWAGFLVFPELYKRHFELYREEEGRIRHWICEQASPSNRKRFTDLLAT